MKIITHVFLVACIFVFALQVNAQSQSSLNQTVSSFIKALEDADEAQLKLLASDKLSYGHSDGLVEDKSAFIANLLNGNTDFVKIEIADQSIVELKNTAIVRHNFSATTNNKGQPGKVKLHVLLIWQKEGARWALLARQATKIL